MGNIKFRSQQGTGEDTSQEQKYAMNDNEPNIVLGEDPNVINNGISKDPLQENSNEPTILDEDISKREENVKYYNMSDGTCRAMYFDEPVHYFNESEGRFRGIDNTLELNQQNGADDFEGYETKYGNISLHEI